MGQTAAFHADMFCFISENLEELLMKDVFETVFCLHEVSQSLTDLLKLLELLLFQDYLLNCYLY